MRHYLTGLIEPRDNGPEIATLLAKLLGVKVSANTFKKEIQEHPNFPSLLSISDVLTHYGIENLGIKFNPDRVEELEGPFITQVKSIKTSIELFTIVKYISDKSIVFFDPEKHIWTTLPKEEFLKRCSGIALLVEVADGAGEREYNKNITEEKLKLAKEHFLIYSIPVLVMLAGFSAILKNGLNALLPGVFLLLTLAGGVISILLLWYELDQGNPLLKQICSAGKKKNCSAILQSKASKIAGVSWSSIGFAYFTGMVLFLLASGLLNKISLYTVAWVNLLALPYIFYSLYYQWFVAKHWCVLCLCVQVILFLQFVIALSGRWYNSILLQFVTIDHVILTVTTFCFAFIVVLVLLPALQKARQSKSLHNELQKLKHNPLIFQALLKKQKMVAEIPRDLGIFLGNPKGTNRVIKVCNPYCNPCAVAHKPIEDLIRNNSDIQLQILFTATNDDRDYRTPPVKHLLSIAHQNDESMVKQALDDWYLADEKSYEAFASKYPIKEDSKRQEVEVEAMRDWCLKTEIKVTPTFFVSVAGDSKFYQLPEQYTVNDLKYFLLK